MASDPADGWSAGLAHPFPVAPHITSPAHPSPASSTQPAGGAAHHLPALQPRAAGPSSAPGWKASTPLTPTPWSLFLARWPTALATSAWHWRSAGGVGGEAGGGAEAGCLPQGCLDGTCCGEVEDTRHSESVCAAHAYLRTGPPLAPGTHSCLHGSTAPSPQSGDHGAGLPGGQGEQPGRRQRRVLCGPWRGKPHLTTKPARRAWRT